MGLCTAWCKMLLFCMKIVMKESYKKIFELVHLKKKKILAA